MGVTEGSEPPLKRPKVPLCDLNQLSEESSHSEFASTSLGDPMARPLSSQGDGETIGPKGVIKKNEFVKIITRALYSLGYDKTGALLEEESGIPLHPSNFHLLMQQATEGQWEDTLETLHKIDLVDGAIKRSASFLILEQKFLELLKEDKYMEAIGILKNRIVPLSINSDRVHELAASIISPTMRDTLGISIQDSDSRNTRRHFLEKLQKLLPPAVTIPESRLEHLVEQALEVQRDACVFHNTLPSEMSLYTDHDCGRSHIPSQPLQILRGHRDEVWFLQFSHNGKYLSSSSKDKSAIIWEVKDDGQISLRHRLSGHQKPILSTSWSPDDKQLLTCGVEEVIRRWDVNNGECLNIYERAGVGLISCGWFPDGKGIVSGMTDKSICLWHLDGRELECWKGHRTAQISDMAITDDGKWIISLCKEPEILLFDREAKVERTIKERDLITSFTLSKDNKYLLVNLLSEEIHLWDIEENPKIVSIFKGLKRSRFIIRSCFGGFEQAFIASGSEDSQVYIWHRNTGELMATLPGHSGAVNCVSWNPKNPLMLASASDDATIRIWGMNQAKRKDKESNGFVQHMNGSSS